MTTGTRIPSWSFGERLAKARDDRGLTQEEMAREFKVGHATIAKWENNHSQPRNLFEVVAKWSEITDVDSGWLLIGPDRESKKPESLTRRNRNGRGATSPGNARPGGAPRPALEDAA
jgi:transcriptional regulator with XRE-family HTH domain